MSDLSGGRGGAGRIGAGTTTKHSKYGKVVPVGAAMENMVRHWVDVASTPNAPREPEVPALVRPEAYIEWGAEGTFEEGDFRQEAGGVGFRVDDDEEPPRERFVFSEQGRKTTDYTIFGVDDPESYAVLRVANQIAFSGPGGAQFRLVLNPHIPGQKTGSGQTPPAPPSLGEMEA